jgi:hypothetical protein
MDVGRPATQTEAPQGELVRRFLWLLENDFVTLEGAGISLRSNPGFEYVGEWSALEAEFSLEDAGASHDRADLRLLHETVYAAVPEVAAIACGFPAHLVALRAEGLPWPPPTSTMEKRFVVDLSMHAFSEEELEASRLEMALERAQAAAAAAGMEHLLILREDGLVCVGARSLSDAMVHYQNVVVCSQVEFLRREERSTPVQKRLPGPQV